MDHRTGENAIAFQMGKEHALRYFHRLYYKALVYYAFQWLNCRQSAEEAASEAFLRTWTNRHKLNQAHAIKAYLYTCTRNLCLDALKARKGKETFETGVADYESSAFDHLVRAEMLRELHNALAELPPASRQVIEMHYLEGKTTGEIARELNKHPSTIKTQKLRALEMLRQKLPRPISWICLMGIKFFLPFL